MTATCSPRLLIKKLRARRANAGTRVTRGEVAPMTENQGSGEDAVTAEEIAEDEAAIERVGRRLRGAVDKDGD